MPPPPSADALVALIAEALGCEPHSVTPDSGYSRHPKWDSLGHLRVMLALEKQYGLALNETAMTTCTSLKAISAYLSTKSRPLPDTTPQP